MPGLIAVAGRDVVAALVAGGFRLARRERGLALLVRDGQVVVVPEDAVLQRTRLLALLERGGVTEEELIGWMSAPDAATRPTITRSGFQRRVAASDGTGSSPRTVADVVKLAQDARARADAADVGAREALNASRELLDRLPRASEPDHARLHAVQASIARWYDALREVEEEEARERRRNKR